MSNIDIEIVWKEIDQLISQAEVSFDETLDYFNNIEKLSKNLLKEQINKSIGKLYNYVIEILKKIINNKKLKNNS